MLHEIRNNSTMALDHLTAIVNAYAVQSGVAFDILKRFDVEDLPRKDLETVELGYEFGIILPKRVYGRFNPFLGASPGPARSLGGRNLRIQNATVTSAWDVIRYDDCGIFPQLTRQNQNVLESYELNNKLAGWTVDRLVVRRDEAPPLHHYDRAISLFGSYMHQWGHVTFDLLMRLLSVSDYPRDTTILLQEDTPPNFVNLVREIWGFSRFEFIPAGRSVTVADLIVPLSRTFSPVGWNPSLDIEKVAWGWVCDGPAWRELKDRVNTPTGMRTAKGQRFYFRRRQRNVQIENASDVDQFLLRQGFKILHLEDLSIVEVKQLLPQAACIVTGFGSHHTNLLFAPEDTRIIIMGAENASPFGSLNMLSYFGMEVSLVGCPRTAVMDAEKLRPYDKKQLPIVVPMRELERAVTDALGGTRNSFIRRLISKSRSHPVIGPGV
jgi:capsular polysaccharide biosynthesis protein